MTAKDFLNQYREADKRSRQAKAEYEKELLMIDSIRSLSDIDDMPHGNGVNKLVEDKAIRLADKAKMWKAAEIDALEMRQEVFGVIYRTEGLERDILVARYIDLLKWAVIPAEVHASYPTVMKYHRLALEEVQKLIG